MTHPQHHITRAVAWATRDCNIPVAERISLYEGSLIRFTRMRLLLPTERHNPSADDRSRKRVVSVTSDHRPRVTGVFPMHCMGRLKPSWTDASASQWLLIFLHRLSGDLLDPMHNEPVAYERYGCSSCFTLSACRNAGQAAQQRPETLAGSPVVSRFGNKTPHMACDEFASSGVTLEELIHIPRR